MKKKDFSIHFTVKEQPLDTIKSLFFGWSKNNDLLAEVEEGEQEPILHSCFLSRQIVKQKGFNTEIVDFLDEIAEDHICWSQVDSVFPHCRYLMLQNLKKINGISIFVGEIKEGVLDEFNLVKELGIDYILIN